MLQRLVAIIAMYWIPKLNFRGEIGGLLEEEARKMGKEGIWNRGGNGREEGIGCVVSNISSKPRRLTMISGTCCSKSFMLTSAGATCMTFVTGAVAFWGPTYIYISVRTVRASADDSR